MLRIIQLIFYISDLGLIPDLFNNTFPLSTMIPKTLLSFVQPSAKENIKGISFCYLKKFWNFFGNEFRSSANFHSFFSML